MPIFADGSAQLDYSQIIKKLNKDNLDADYIEPPQEYPLLHTAVLKNIPQAYRAIIDFYREKYLHRFGKYTFQEAINLRDVNGQTALHHACMQRNHELVKFLMEAGASDDIADTNGNLPLHIAAQTLNLKITEYLLTKRQLNFLMNLLNSNSDVDEVDRDYKEAKVNALNQTGFTPLLTAMLMHAANVEDEHNKEKIIIAILDKYNQCHFDEDEKLPRLESNTYLVYAILSRLNLTIIEKIAQKNPIQIDKKKSDGTTALHLAILAKDTELVVLLLRYGANPYIKNDAGKTALHLAADQKNIDAEILELLLEHVATLGQLDPVDNEGNTPFHIAVSHCNEYIAKLFIDYGANINAEDIVGNTPLHISVLALARATNDEDSIKHQQVYFYLNDFGDQAKKNHMNKSASDILNGYMTTTYEYSDIDLHEPSTQSNLSSNDTDSDNNGSHVLIARRLNTNSISSISPTPASTARSDNENSIKPLLPNVSLKNSKPKGLIENLNYYRISQWRKFKITRVGRFVRKHPYISAVIFAIALTGFVALCVFVPPIAAKIPIFLAVKKLLTVTQILTTTSQLLAPIAKTIAMVLPVMSIALACSAIKLGHILYSRITLDNKKNKPNILVENGIKSARLRESKQHAASNAAYKINKERIAVSKPKSENFSICDYLSTCLVSCFSKKEQNVKALKEKGKIDNIENPTFDATRFVADANRMSI